MILHELTGHDEDDPVYRSMEVANGERHYDFLQSVVEASLEVDAFPVPNGHRSLNYHAIA